MSLAVQPAMAANAIRSPARGYSPTMLPWRQPLGATPRADGTVECRVWAPRPERVAVRVRGADHEMADAGHGVREAVVEAGPGDEYWFVLDGEALPDPASRSQPEGLRGPSRVVTVERPRALERAPALQDLVVYELHVGTFSPEGTFDGAIGHLAGLRDLGVTAIEVMPIAEFPGRHGWGYDGVYLSAAHSA